MHQGNIQRRCKRKIGKDRAGAEGCKKIIQLPALFKKSKSVVKMDRNQNSTGAIETK
jgi:hypothetical protein